MTPADRIAELEAELHQQREHIGRLLSVNGALPARVQELEARLAKDSHNSGKPPSNDGLRRETRKTKSLRKRSGKRPGGQLGHRGETLRLVAVPDAVVEQRPAVCGTCHAALGTDAPVLVRERRQILELPPLRLVGRELQALHLRCPACQTVMVGTFPTEASSRAQYGPRLRALVVYLVEQQLVPYGRVRELLADLFAVHLSLGTLVAWVQQGAATLEPVEAQIKAALLRARVLHNDETGVRQAGRVAWAHVGSGASTARLTHYAIHAQRGCDATDANGILPRYTGVSVHDGWKPYRAHTRCRHAASATSLICACASSPSWRRSTPKPGPKSSRGCCAR